MALADSRNAIGAVGDLLQAQLMARTSVSSVEVGRVETSANGAAGPKYNLFLYQVDVDGQLRNFPLDEGQRTPLWLVLRYLLVAFDQQRDSDSADAHRMLGEGMLALQELNFQRPAVAALADNPEPLKITFDSGDVELLSKVMQGSDESYRVACAFQVRPIMIAPGEPPAYSPLVQFVGQPANEGVMVMPGLGPHLETLTPEKFDAGATLTLRGTDLNSAIQWVCLGATCYPVTGAPSGAVVTEIPLDTALSAGTYPVTVARDLPSGRRMHSNPLLGQLQPTLDGVLAVLPLTDDGSGNLFGGLVLNGRRLGGPDDAIFVAFWRDGNVVLMLEADGAATQDTLAVGVGIDDALTPGFYRILLRVNGAQAVATPEVDWS
jgi:hypothetical protein